MDAVIAVAEDISPEWAKALRDRRESEPRKFFESLNTNARRLMILAVLKRRNPEIYQLRVEDLRIQNDLKKLADQYRAANSAGDAALAGNLVEQIRSKVRRQVDLDLKARAMELAALDQQMKRMREELGEETRARDDKAERIVEGIKAGEDPKPLMRPGGPLGGEPREPRDGKDGKDGKDGRDNRDNRDGKEPREPRGEGRPRDADRSPPAGAHPAAPPAAPAGSR